MLDRRRILIAEDEALVAYELALAVEAAGGEVVGPVASVQEGLRLLAAEFVDAAILDVRLTDRNILPIAFALLEHGKVVVFHSASQIPPEIVERFGAPTVCPKPMGSDRVVARLAELLRQRPGNTVNTPLPPRGQKP